MNSTAQTLRFAPISGHTVRADFSGGGLSSDFGSLLLSNVDRQIGLTKRLASVLHDPRHPSYIKHGYSEILAQRVYQIACGYEDANDANTLRHDPIFRMSVGRMPFDDDSSLSSPSTISRFEHAMTPQDIYRFSQALVEQYVASFATPPQTIILDLDHTEDAVHGQQPLAFYSQFYQSTCYLPLVIFDGRSGAMIAAILRPGKRPVGAENAMIMKRVLKLLRKHFPQTHILVRGDGHFSNPELMQVIADMPNMDFIFGLAGNAKVHKLAESTKQRALALWTAAQSEEVVPSSVRVFAQFDYAAASWAKEWRVIVKAEVNEYGEVPRYVVTSLTSDTPEEIYEEIYCGRGQSENFIKHLKNDLASDRTSCKTFLANCMRLLQHAAAYVLHQQLRTEALQGTELAQAQPATIIKKLFKIAVQVKQTKNRITLHLPSACPMQNLLHTLAERLYLCKPARLVDSS